MSEEVFKTEEEKISYALGIDIGQSFKQLPVKVNIDLLSQGIADVFLGKEIKMSQEEWQKTMAGFQQKMKKHGEAIQKNMSETNSKEGESFLAENQKRPEVKVTESGLQYEVLVEGEGDCPKNSDKVTVHYAGTLINGTEFDSSIKRGTPASFPVNGVIPGWTEALQIMKVGSKYKLFIPSALAYGPQGAGQNIGPNSTLIFEVELIKID